MIRIAIVEDDPVYTGQLQGYLEEYGRQSDERFTVTCFSDGDEIALDYKAEYDIILMDIDMRFMNGMTAAEEIRRFDQDVVIIFITNLPQYAIKGYAVNALDYVLKPISYYAFSQCIDRALSRMQYRRAVHFLKIETKEGVRRLDRTRIAYVEVDGRQLIFHTTQGLITGPGPMGTVEKQLEGAGFFRCNKGYLINLEHVSAIEGDSVVVAGERLQVSRAKRKALISALNDYMNEVSK